MLFSMLFLPDQAVTQASVIMENLQTLSKVRNFRCTEKICENMPNQKELSIYFDEEKRDIDWSYYRLYNLNRLHKLESLSIHGGNHLLLENLTFPTSLKELCLDGCHIPWKKMMTLGSLLSNLEVLKLILNAFSGPVWNQVEGKFPRLKVLIIDKCDDLEWWEAEDIHFPNLESLILHYMDELEEIPAIIGDIPTLHSIHVVYCNSSLVKSAIQILEEQHDLGNENLHLYIDYRSYQVGSSSS
ncbi:UNVERIFIED_CONTAM: hypothetical protein Slati_4190900 [Sesamum latifolium]|uniref:Uncharacterized protein n=1 Tax=Sesamum latifolium TaxID=2727402 RepID=A0AAW2TB36_9LAMI